MEELVKGVETLHQPNRSYYEGKPAWKYPCQEKNEIPKSPQFNPKIPEKIPHSPKNIKPQIQNKEINQNSETSRKKTPQPYFPLSMNATLTFDKNNCQNLRPKTT